MIELGHLQPPSYDRRPCLIQINSVATTIVHPCAMARCDWKYTLSLAATLTLAVGAICILLFAM
jgi:hypothetical protein